MGRAVHEITRPPCDRHTEADANTAESARSVPTILVRGDEHPALHDLIATTGTLNHPPASQANFVPERIRGVVGCIHLPTADTASPAKMRSRLKDERNLARILGEQLPRLSHLLFVLDTGAPQHTQRLARLASSAITRIHADIEMTAGRSVCVTAIVLDRTADPTVLRDRICERLRDNPIEGSFLLKWSEIVQSSIRDVVSEALS